LKVAQQILRKEWTKKVKQTQKLYGYEAVLLESSVLPNPEIAARYKLKIIYILYFRQPIPWHLGMAFGRSI
jgi:hypothetical protein